MVAHGGDTRQIDAVGGFTFTQWLNSLWSNWWLLFLAPIVVGVGGTLWGGNAAAGRRVVRLATVTAVLGIYLYGVLAVAAVGAAGDPLEDGFTKAYVVNDRLGNQVVFYLLALPLMTVALGWAAAAATARLRHLPPVPAQTNLATENPRSPAMGTPGTARLQSPTRPGER